MAKNEGPAPDWDLEAERAIMGGACKDRLWFFVKYAEGVALNPRGVWLDPLVHERFCDTLQAHILRWMRKRGKHLYDGRIMAVLPREVGKTVVITKGAALWMHLHDPDLATTLDSATAKRSTDFLRSVKAVVTGQDPYAQFARYYGNWKDRDRLWNTDEFVHSKRVALGVSEPSFSTCSVETGVTSYHPDVLVLDDPITFEKLREEGNWLDVVNRHLISLGYALKRGGLFIFIGTPYDDRDAINTLAREEGFWMVHGQQPSFPYREGGKWSLFYLPGRAPGGAPNYPRVWSEEKMQREEKRSPKDFASQVLCSPLQGEFMPITREQMDKRWVTIEQVPRNVVATLHLDTAFKTPERAGRGDYNVIVEALHSQDGRGDVYYRNILRSNQWSQDEFLENLAAAVMRLRRERIHIRAITDEPEIGGHRGVWVRQIRSFLANLNIPSPPILTLERAGNKKSFRIAEVAGFWTDGHVFLVRGAQGIMALHNEMLNGGSYGGHDDTADAAADAFHEKVYFGMQAPGDHQRWTEPVRPFDDMLKGGTDAYDDHILGLMPYRREPIQ